MKNDNWRTKTLQQLDNDDWGEANAHDTSMVKECHRLRRVPLNQFDIYALRMMIGQQISLPYLIPLALEILRDAPLAEDVHEGDLLNAVLRVPDEFWHQSPDLKQQLDEIKPRAVIALSEMEVEETNYLSDLRNTLKQE